MSSAKRVAQDVSLESTELAARIEDRAPSLDTVSAFAGDRALTASEQAQIDLRRTADGDLFYSELLYAFTHQVFEPQTAARLWYRILKHKYEMSALVKRNVRITVAGLDYLSNVSNLVASATVVSEDQYREYVHRSRHDGLTGLHTHSHCLQRLEFEVRRYCRYGDPVSIIMVDVDHFKEVNDTSGHTVGDTVLSEVAAVLEAETRDCDMCCRYGGDEFLVTLPATELRRATLLARRLQKRVEEYFRDSLKLTVSVGVATCSENTRTARALILQADEALYAVKRHGRNGVRAAQTPGHLSPEEKPDERQRQPGPAPGSTSVEALPG